MFPQKAITLLIFVCCFCEIALFVKAPTWDRAFQVIIVLVIAIGAVAMDSHIGTWDE